MGRRRRRRKQLPDDLKKKRGYWKSKEGTLDCTVWETRLRRQYGPLVRQTAERRARHKYIFKVNKEPTFVIEMQPLAATSPVHTGIYLISCSSSRQCRIIMERKKIHQMVTKTSCFVFAT